MSSRTVPTVLSHVRHSILTSRPPTVLRGGGISRRTFSSRQTRAQMDNLHDRNTRIALYASSMVIGALGATYASVPLYKMFCQATGFGGTTQRVIIDYGDDANIEDSSPEDFHEGPPGLSTILKYRIIRGLDNLYDTIKSLTYKTQQADRIGNTHGNTWTDEDAKARLSTLRPVKDGRLLRIYFDTNTSDVLPWTFTPNQSSIRVVPGETALCFFRATNNSDKPIVGVATYNVHPPKAGLYFNKVQCFCFEEQRLLPGETVDMPVFFYIDPDFESDPYLDRCQSITLSYTFFKTDEEDLYLEDDDEDED